MRNTKRTAVACLAAALLAAGVMTSASASILGDIVGIGAKVGGIGLVINKYGDSINSAINAVMNKEGAGTSYATKVVPIISLGSKSHFGAAQVVGDADQVEQVQAVGQLSVDWNDRMFEIKGLIPINSQDPTNFSRVQGVGVSAIIDVKL